MPLEIQNLNTSGVVIADARYADEVVTLPIGVFVEGTLLAFNTSTNKYVPYDQDVAANGLNSPKAMIKTTVATTAAGDNSLRILLGGRVYINKLVEHGETRQLSEAGKVELRKVGILGIDSTQITSLDNQ